MICSIICFEKKDVKVPPEIEKEISELKTTVDTLTRRNSEIETKYASENQEMKEANKALEARLVFLETADKTIKDLVKELVTQKVVKESKYVKDFLADETLEAQTAKQP